MNKIVVVRPVSISPSPEEVDLSQQSLTCSVDRDVERRAELERLRRPRNPGEALLGALFAFGAAVELTGAAAGGTLERECSPESQRPQRSRW